MERQCDSNTMPWFKGSNYVRSPVLTHVQCQHCFEWPKRILTCSGCKSEYYCGKACQKADWRYHREACIRFRTGVRRGLRDTKDDDFTRRKFAEASRDVRKWVLAHRTLLDFLTNNEMGVSFRPEVLDQLLLCIVVFYGPKPYRPGIKYRFHVESVGLYRKTPDFPEIPRREIPCPATARIARRESLGFADLLVTEKDTGAQWLEGTEVEAPMVVASKVYVRNAKQLLREVVTGRVDEALVLREVKNFAALTLLRCPVQLHSNSIGGEKFAILQLTNEHPISPNALLCEQDRASSPGTRLKPIKIEVLYQAEDSDEEQEATPERPKDEILKDLEDWYTVHQDAVDLFISQAVRAGINPHFARDKLVGIDLKYVPVEADGRRPPIEQRFLVRIAYLAHDVPPEVWMDRHRACRVMQDAGRSAASCSITCQNNTLTMTVPLDDLQEFPCKTRLMNPEEVLIWMVSGRLTPEDVRLSYVQAVNIAMHQIMPDGSDMGVLLREDDKYLALWFRLDSQPKMVECIVLPMSLMNPSGNELALQVRLADAGDEEQALLI